MNRQERADALRREDRRQLVGFIVQWFLVSATVVAGMCGLVVIGMVLLGVGQ